MKAQIRFVLKPNFNAGPGKIISPGILIGRAEGRRMWPMSFTVEKQVNDLVYIGNLSWITAPVEQDFGKGIRFHLISDPNKYLDGPSTLGMIAEGELLG